MRRLPDRLWRILFRVGYRCARIMWAAYRPQAQGALVAVWCQGMVLAVQASYRHGWSFPGGGLKPAEPPRIAAARELSEEIGLAVDPNRLSFVRTVRGRWHGRDHHDHLFELDLPVRPALRPDGREIVMAAWFSPGDLAAALQPPWFAEYLRHRRSGSSG